MSKRIYDFGDVVRADILFPDQSGDKLRPAVIISTREYNTARRDVIIAAISSRLQQMGGFAVVEIPDWKEAGLEVESVIKPVIFTIILTDIKEDVGKLSTETKTELKLALAMTFGFRPSSTARAPHS